MVEREAYPKRSIRQQVATGQLRAQVVFKVGGKVDPTTGDFLLKRKLLK